MNYQQVLDEIWQEVASLPPEGEVASYIPELAKVNPNAFGAHLCDVSGGHYAIGESEKKFSIQSISKVFSLTLAISLAGDPIWKRVGVEPSGDPFNSMIQLEFEQGIPRNPLINAGALVICDYLIGQLKDPKADYLRFIQKIAGDDTISYNYSVAASEKQWGHRNAAMANLMKAFGNIHHDIEKVLDLYFHICAIEMSCRQLAKTFLLYTFHGKVPHTGEQLLTLSQAKRLNAIMQTCGFYDEAGEFSFRVGLPGKSGVGGGIAAIHPGEYSVAVWSPRLNPKGNSFLGMKVLELLTTKTGRSIF